MEKRNARAVSHRDLDDPLDVLRKKRRIPMNPPLAALRQDRFTNQRRRATRTLARIPKREAQVLLAVAAQQVPLKIRVDRRGNGDRESH